MLPTDAWTVILVRGGSLRFGVHCIKGFDAPYVASCRLQRALRRRPPLRVGESIRLRARATRIAESCALMRKERIDGRAFLVLASSLRGNQHLRWVQRHGDPRFSIDRLRVADL